ncbi:MAG: hypothetical protein LUG93_14810 [Lachnospiraceae bacterium]|nr:hypothetical protein [Lachnospiraceae bacterium]
MGDTISDLIAWILAFALFFAICAVGVYVIFFAALAFAAFYAVKNYVLAILHNINFREWEWTEREGEEPEPARRSYFFGPGYVQLANTIKESFLQNWSSIESLNHIAERIQGARHYTTVMSTEFFRLVMAWAFRIFAYISIFVFGTILCAIFGLLHGTVTTVVMLIIYAVFSVVWFTDRTYLNKNRIFSDCPVCHSRFLVPVFACPECGRKHKHLIPGPYGIWHHKCDCGTKISSVFLNGRSRLEGYCPDCGAPLAAADARPIAFQMIGGTKSGKTVFLTSFYHIFQEYFLRDDKLNPSIPKLYEASFHELEGWYRSANCPPTAQMNSRMYPLLIESPLEVKRMLTVYDIAGEMFDGIRSDEEITQRQFKYCNGFLLFLDPFSSGKLRQRRLERGEGLEHCSEMTAESVVGNFINYIDALEREKVEDRYRTPVAVLIPKADEEEVGEFLRKDSSSDACRTFLISQCSPNAVYSLEAKFTNVRYFPISAIGHAPDGSAFAPWGIEKVIKWLLPQADEEFSRVCGIG